MSAAAAMPATVARAKIVLRIMGPSPSFVGCARTSCLSVEPTIRGVQRSALKLSGIVRIAAAPGCASGGPLHPLDQERLKLAAQLVGQTAPWLHAPTCVTPCRASARSL